MINGHHRLGLWLGLAACLLGCRSTSHGDEGAAPVATEIPQAAANARGADYPPPARISVTPEPPRDPLPPPEDEVEDPFLPPPAGDGTAGGTQL